MKSHIQSQTKQHKCPTRTRTFLETSDLNKHRAHRPKCQQQRQAETHIKIPARSKDVTKHSIVHNNYKHI